MNGLYAKGREKFLQGAVSWPDDDIVAVFVTAAYTPDFDVDEYLADIAVGARIATSDVLADKTTTGGWAGSGNIVWQTVTGPTCVAFVVVHDTGDVATSPLLAYIDTGVTNLPLDPSGVKVTLIPDPDTGLFRL